MSLKRPVQARGVCQWQSETECQLTVSSQYEYLQDKRSTMTKDKAEEKERDRLSQERGFATNVEDRHVRERGT